MSRVFWALAAVAVGVGYVQFGWQGVLFAVSMAVFFLLAQFGRALRTLRAAGTRPLGHVDSAVMLNARIKRGMSMLQMVTLTGSLGRQTSKDPDQWTWADPGGAAVVLTFVRGKIRQWELTREATPRIQSPPLQ